MKAQNDSMMSSNLNDRWIMKLGSLVVLLVLMLVIGSAQLQAGNDSSSGQDKATQQRL